MTARTDRGEDIGGDRVGGETAHWVWQVHQPRALIGRTEELQLPIGARALAGMERAVTLVWKKTKSKPREPWVVIAESAALRKTGSRGLGMYAWKDFAVGKHIGQYSGEVVGEAEDAGTMAEVERRQAAGADMIVHMRQNCSAPYVAMDGESGGAPFVQRANDARGLTDTSGKKLYNTVSVDNYGVMRSNRQPCVGKVSNGTRWGKKVPDGGWAEAVRREILWPYRGKYWPRARTVETAEEEEEPSDGETTGDVQHERAARMHGATSDNVVTAPHEGEAADGRRSDATGVGGAADDNANHLEALAGGLMYEVGHGRLMSDSTRGVIMFVTQVWVHEEQRRKGWATEAIVREARRKRADEVHLIAIDGDAVHAYEGMGMERASGKDIEGGRTTVNPSTAAGEVYMHAKTRDMESQANGKGIQTTERHGRRLERVTRCRQVGGDWYETAYMSAVRRMYSAHQNWRPADVMPSEQLEQGCVFMIVVAAQEGEHGMATEAEEGRKKRERHERAQARKRRQAEAEATRAREARDAEAGGATEGAGHMETEEPPEDDGMHEQQEDAPGEPDAETGHRAEPTAEDRQAEADADDRWMMTYNCNGLRMQMRRPGGRRIAGAWGNGRDLRARPDDTAARTLREVREGNALVAVLTDTHLEGEELTAMRGYMAGMGFDSSATDAENGRGGVIVMWDAGRMAKIGKEKVVIGARMVAVTLRELGSDMRMEVVGTYVHCRGSANMDTTDKDGNQPEWKSKVKHVWKALEEKTKGNEKVVVAGDLNAETRTALARAGRGAKWQDNALQRMIGEAQLHTKSVRRATYQERSEIDHILAGREAAEILHRPEWRPGRSTSDHGQVWVRVAPTVEAGTREHRPKGPRVKEADGWTEKRWELFRELEGTYMEERETVDDEEEMDTIAMIQETLRTAATDVNAIIRAEAAAAKTAAAGNEAKGNEHGDRAEHAGATAQPEQAAASTSRDEEEREATWEDAVLTAEDEMEWLEEGIGPPEPIEEEEEEGAPEPGEEEQGAGTRPERRDQEERMTAEPMTTAELAAFADGEGNGGGEDGGSKDGCGEEGKDGKRQQQTGGGTAAGRLQRSVARWARVEAAARRWTGRNSRREWHSTLRADSRWTAQQGWAKEARAKRTRWERREALMKATREGLKATAAKWMRYLTSKDGDEMIGKIRSAAKRAGGGVYAELCKIVNAEAETGFGGSDQKLRTVYIGGEEANGMATGAANVLAEAREQGRAINAPRHMAATVVKDIITWAGKGDIGRRTRPATTMEAEDWVDDVCTWERYLAGVAKTTATKGVGADGFNAYLLKKATEATQRRYWTALKGCIRKRTWPEQWKDRIAMLAMKPGEEPANLARRRDLWLECHGSKLTMWLLGAEYEAAAGWTVPASQAGSAVDRGCPEQSLVMRCQKEQCAAEQEMCCRAYLDMGTFFMSTIRETQWEVERWCQVRPGVTEVVKALYEGATGRYETAYGLTEQFPLATACFQGCSQSPTRSKFQLRLVQEAVRKLCEGYRFRGCDVAIPQMWYCDDGAFVAKDLATLQLILDTCWLVTRAAGLKIMIKETKKTAWQASYWMNGVEREVEGWEMVLPDGRVVPQVKASAEKKKDRTYTYLGGDESAMWQDASQAVRVKVLGYCNHLLWKIGRVGVLSDVQQRIGMALATNGAMGFHARSTVIGDATCEAIEHTRAEVLRQDGVAAGSPRLQIHASKAAGGLGHQHVMQHAAANLADQFERMILSKDDTPGRNAVMAHIRATYVRLGWTQRGEMLEWHPTHLQDTLNEDMVVEGWLAQRMRAGIRLRVATERRTEAIPENERGPPIWELDDREEWRPDSTQLCMKVEGGKVRTWLAHRGACRHTLRSRRMAARGIREWADVTHEAGRWKTWPEINAEYMENDGTASDQMGYEHLVHELSEGRWAAVRERWWSAVAAWRTLTEPAQNEPTVTNVTAARRTAGCHGGWEYLVQWHGTEERTWERHDSFIKAGSGGQRQTKQMAERARQRHQVPHSLRERLWDAGNASWKKQDRMTAAEVEAAVHGDLQSTGARAAMRKLWQMFSAVHAKQIHGEGRQQTAGEINGAETPAAERKRQQTGVTGRTARGHERTLYLGGVETASSPGGEQGDQKKEARARAGLEEPAEGQPWVSVTYEMARQRVALDTRLRERMRRDTEESGTEEARRARGGMPLPEGRPNEDVWWDPEEENLSRGKGIWRGSLSEEGEAEVVQDPLLRLMMEWHEFSREKGRATVRAADGTRVRMDDQEAGIMAKSRSDKEDTKVLGPAMALHMVHHFTDVWATDGSRSVEMGEDGRNRTVVGAGAYQGRQSVPRRGNVDVDEWRREQFEAGLRCARLPDHYQVVDAELAAILLVLQEAAAQADAAERKCLIMSDCTGALKMVEAAWRGEREGYAKRGRGAMLEAICTAREALQLVVTMYVPAHRGNWANGVADAAAKAGTGRAHGDISERILAGVRWRVTVQTIEERDEEGRAHHEVWDDRAFKTMREATGWWIRGEERRRLAPHHDTRMVDVEKIGRPWAPTTPGRRWEAVWESTGAGARVEKEANEEGDEEDENGDTDVEKRRVGVAMAARAYDVWELTEGRTWEQLSTSGSQGCPACCGKRNGWGWVMDLGDQECRRKWVGPAGQEATEATAQHVLCGSCTGDEEAPRRRTELIQCMRAIQRATQTTVRRSRQTTGGRKRLPTAKGDGGAYGSVRRMVAIALKAVHSKEWDQRSAEAFRRTMAGDMPAPDQDEGEAQRKGAARRVSSAVRQLQHAVADMREAWRRASIKERNRRQEERRAEKLRYGVLREWKAAVTEGEMFANMIKSKWRKHRSRQVVPQPRTSMEMRVAQNPTGWWEEGCRQRTDAAAAREAARKRQEIWAGRKKGDVSRHTRNALEPGREGQRHKALGQGQTLWQQLIMFQAGRRAEQQQARQPQATGMAGEDRSAQSVATATRRAGKEMELRKEGREETRTRHSNAQGQADDATTGAEGGEIRIADEGDGRATMIERHGSNRPARDETSNRRSDGDRSMEQARHWATESNDAAPTHDAGTEDEHMNERRAQRAQAPCMGSRHAAGRQETGTVGAGQQATRQHQHGKGTDGTTARAHGTDGREEDDAVWVAHEEREEMEQAEARGDEAVAGDKAIWKKEVRRPETVKTEGRAALGWWYGRSVGHGRGEGAPHRVNPHGTAQYGSAAIARRWEIYRTMTEQRHDGRNPTFDGCRQINGWEQAHTEAGPSTPTVLVQLRDGRTTVARRSYDYDGASRGRAAARGRGEGGARARAQRTLGAQLAGERVDRGGGTAAATIRMGPRSVRRVEDMTRGECT